MRKTLSVAILLGAALMSGALGLSCSVTQKGDQTTYTIPASTGRNCEYSWSNATDHVLANQDEEPKEPVVAKSQTSLTTNTCIGNVRRKRDCLSGESDTILCIANCSGNTGPQTGIEDHRNTVITVSVALSAVAIFIIIIIIIITVIHCRKTRFRRVNVEEQQAGL